MMDTLRNSIRLVEAALMNSELVYSLLMGMGWFFLIGWAIALLVACASAFRQERRALAGVSVQGQAGRLTRTGRG
jgi:hypothetical protein